MNHRTAYHIDAVESQPGQRWTWHVMPALIAVAALSVIFPMSSGTVSADAVEPDAMPLMAGHVASLTSAAQPGEGEPELKAENLSQSY